MTTAKKTKKATFGAGCFWGVEASFRRVPGVVGTTVGYEGGHLDHPTYAEVCNDRSGHAEVVEVEYDPARVSYEALLDAFWACHDPTQRNRQGVDVGSQYRSVIFVNDTEEAEVACRAKAALDASGRYPRRVVTEIVPASVFWRAEEHHQRHYERRGMDPTCRS